MRRRRHDVLAGGRTGWWVNASANAVRDIPKETRAMFMCSGCNRQFRRVEVQHHNCRGTETSEMSTRRRLAPPSKRLADAERTMMAIACYGAAVNDEPESRACADFERT